MNQAGSPTWLRRTLFPFGWGNITKLALVYFFSTLYFYIPVGTLYLQSKNLDYVQINSLWGIIVLTMFLTEVPTGIIADRIGHKRAINVALGLQLLGEVIYIFAQGYVGFALSAAIGGIGFAFASGCVDALAYDTLQKAGRQAEMSKAMGTIEAAQRLANLIAFSTSSLLIGTLTQDDFSRAVIVTACAVAVGFLVSLSLSEPDVIPENTQPSHPGSWHLLRDGIRLLRQNRSFRLLVVLAIATVPFRDYLGSLYQPYLIDAGVAPAWLGLALSAASGLSILGARYAYWFEARLGHHLGLFLASILPGLLYLTAAAIVHPLGSVLAFCALRGSMSLRSPILSGQLNAHIESKNRATVLSTISMISGLYVSLSGVLIGLVANRSVRQALLLMGVVIVVGTLLASRRHPFPAQGAH